ncbi:MAG: NTP transferase domain-containing protein [Chryseolinea sp.]
MQNNFLQEDLYGLVLAGGKSKRMGVDKGSIRYHKESQRENVFNLLSALCSQVYTSCNADQSLDESLHPMIDAYDVDGPMNGILSAFKKHSDKAWLIVAVDLPNITLETLKQLVDARNKQRLSTCYFNSEAGAPEPLLTIWEPAAFPLLVEYVERGNKSPRDFLSSNDVEMITTMNLAIFLNINNATERDQWLRRD